MIELMHKAIVQVLHTKEGSRVAMICIWHGTPKDRKAIIKSFKTYIRKICMEEYGHLVMLAVFDSVDDTVLVKKVIIPVQPYAVILLVREIMC
jgi:pumilio family protein 6